MKRVVITGIGAVTSLGCSGGEILSSLQQEKTAFKRPGFDNSIVICPVNGFDVKSFTGRFKNSRYLNRGAAFALAAAINAVTDAGIPGRLLQQAGLYVGCGPNLDISEEFPDIKNRHIPWEKHAALWILKFLPNTAASAISQFLNIHGESATFGTACAASLQAMGNAFQKIKWGELPAALAGGGDSRLSQSAVMAYKKAGALYTGQGDPDQACCPFDRDRSGFVCGEGGAFFVLEELDHARQRKALIYGEICGFAASADGYAMTAPEPNGRWAKEAVKKAIDQANVCFDEIDLICAHGTSTPLNDSVEAGLLHELFADTTPAVTGIKSWIGHLSAACGAAELAIVLFCLQKKIIPPVRNLTHPCADIGFVMEAPARFSPKAILLENFGFGGQNCAMVVKPWTL
ncbi:MAG: beta-ketoacyl-[acyl-carrier-protein] synthase family protein [Desulfobacteraceae bacterium]